MSTKLSKTKFIIIVLVFYICLYVALKLFIVYTQDLYMDNKVYDKKYNIGKVLKIESYTDEEQEETDYFSSASDVFQMKIKNYFYDFEAGDSDDNYEYYILYDDENNVTAILMLGQFETQLHNIKSHDQTSSYYEFNHYPLYISNLLRNYYLNKYQIKDDVDLIKHIREREKIDARFKTPIIRIKENYFYNFIETNLPSLENITYLEGDLKGYMYETDTYKQACIIHHDKLYCIAFYRLDYFTDDIIEDILRSLIIEK